MTSKYQEWMKRLGPVEDLDSRKILLPAGIFDPRSNLSTQHIKTPRAIKWCHKSNTPQEKER